MAAGGGIVKKLAEAIFKMLGKEGGQGGKALSHRLAHATAETGKKLRHHGGPPGAILVKRDARGAVTNYAHYDQHGEITKRVDLTGRPHAGIPTPHTLDYKTNITPDGRRFPGPDGNVRPATPDEIP
jgi:hypothetical protein